MNYLGVILGLFLVYYFSSSFYIRFIRPPTSWKEYEGEWAIVTGASYGLGASYAKSLALRNINVVLVARTKSKLEAVEKKVRELNPKVKTKIIAVDLAARESYKVIKEEMKGLIVSVLILNVAGVKGDVIFLDYGTKDEDAIEYDINLNLMSPLRLSRLFLASMAQRNKGRIIAVSSVVSVGVPFVSLYSATKAALENWAGTIRAELAILNYDGVQIMVTNPAGIITPLMESLPHGREDPTLISPDELAELDLNLFGSETFISATVAHSITYHIMRFIHMLPISMHDAFFRSALLKLERVPLHRIKKDEL